MKKLLLFNFVLIFCFSGNSQIQKYQEALKFGMLPSRWDEAIPLGNGGIDKKDKILKNDFSFGNGIY